MKINEINLTERFKDLAEQDRFFLLQGYLNRAISYQIDDDIIITYSHLYNKISISKKV